MRLCTTCGRSFPEGTAQFENGKPSDCDRQTDCAIFSLGDDDEVASPAAVVSQPEEVPLDVAVAEPPEPVVVAEDEDVSAYDATVEGPGGFELSAADVSGSKELVLGGSQEIFEEVEQEEAPSLQILASIEETLDDVDESQQLGAQTMPNFSSNLPEVVVVEKVGPSAAVRVTEERKRTRYLVLGLGVMVALAVAALWLGYSDQIMEHFGAKSRGADVVAPMTDSKTVPVKPKATPQAKPNSEEKPTKLAAPSEQPPQAKTPDQGSQKKSDKSSPAAVSKKKAVPKQKSPAAAPKKRVEKSVAKTKKPAKVVQPKKKEEPKKVAAPETSKKQVEPAPAAEEAKPKELTPQERLRQRLQKLKKK